MFRDGSQQADVASVGRSSTNYAVIDTRDPTANDIYYPIGKFWINQQNLTIWYLNNQTNISGNLQSVWVQLDSVVTDDIRFVNVQSGVTPIESDVNGNIFVNGAVVAAGSFPVRTVGTGINTFETAVQISQAIASTDATKIGLSAYDSAAFDVDANGFVTLNGGGIATTSFNVDANTAPGTDPVVPNGSGQVTVTGGQVASGTVGANVIRTDSLAANTFTIEIQRTTTSASTDSTKNGVSHFNSTEFTVDSNGFVSLIGGSAAIDSIAVQTGTSPVVPNGAGLVTFNGATVAAGSNPVRTDGTGPNTYALEVQFSQAIASTDATKVGLASFDSTDFTVDANGYVQLNGGGGYTWIDENTSFAATKTNGYFVTAVATATLPASPAQGDTIKFISCTASVVTIQASGSQIIKIANTSSSAGGSAASTLSGDSVELVYRTADTTWHALNGSGMWNLT